MERKEVQPVFVWNKNRATTMLLLGISILLVVYVGNMFIKLVYLSNEANELEQKLNDLILENETIQGNETPTGDMTITVYENYMTNGEEVSIKGEINSIEFNDKENKKESLVKRFFKWVLKSK